MGRGILAILMLAGFVIYIIAIAIKKTAAATYHASNGDFDKAYQALKPRDSERIAAYSDYMRAYLEKSEVPLTFNAASLGFIAGASLALSHLYPMPGSVVSQVESYFNKFLNKMLQKELSSLSQLYVNLDESQRSLFNAYFEKGSNLTLEVFLK